MNRKLVTALIAGGLVFTAGAASAQSWRSLHDRQDRLHERIDRGVERGAITGREAHRLRAQFDGIRRLEARYRRDGLSRWERADLDRRFDALSARIRDEAHDRQRYGYGYYH